MTTAQQMLEFYIEAEIAVLGGQSITRNGRTWTKADLRTIQTGRREWEKKVRQQRGGSMKLAEFV